MCHHPSVGEKSYDQYQAYYEAGANRFFCAMRTANEEHYKKLHPESLSLENRKECLRNLKKIGYQVGTGFMVGSPYQTLSVWQRILHLLKNCLLRWLESAPSTHKETPFKDFPAGSMDLTLFLIGLIRLMLTNALIPATTALGTIDPKEERKEFYPAPMFNA